MLTNKSSVNRDTDLRYHLSQAQKDLTSDAFLKWGFFFLIKKTHLASPRIFDAERNECFDASRVEIIRSGITYRSRLLLVYLSLELDFDQGERNVIWRKTKAIICSRYFNVVKRRRLISARLVLFLPVHAIGVKSCSDDKESLVS